VKTQGRKDRNRATAMRPRLESEIPSAGTAPTLVPRAMGEALSRLGIRQAFGLVGSGNFHLVNAMVESGIRFVPARHETGSITMADAYARASGRLGVCSVHQGPGFTNAITGLAEAAKSRTPLLFIAAEAVAPQSNFFVDQAGLAAAAGATVRRVPRSENAVDELVQAAKLAVSERRAIYLGIPLDVQTGNCGRVSEAVEISPQSGRAAAHAECVRIAALLASAKRPLLLAGRGAVIAEGREAIERLGNQTGALLATSAVAAGFFAGSPWSLGISGGFATPLGAQLIAEADVIVAFGASLNMWTTRRGRAMHPEAKVAHVDLDPSAIGLHHRVDAGAVGDASATASAISQLLAAKDTRGWRSPRLQGEISRSRWGEQPFEDASNGYQIDPRALTIALDRMLPNDRTLAVDSGHFMGWAPMYLDVPDGRSFVFTQSFMSVGIGLATGIGAALARPDRMALIALGDGGALMSLPELETLARLNLGALVVVYNDAAYSAEVHHFASEGTSMETVKFPDTDFAALAVALGIEAVTARTARDLEPVSNWLARGRPKPLLLDAKIVPSVVGEWLEDAFRGH